MFAKFSDAERALVSQSLMLVGWGCFQDLMESGCFHRKWLGRFHMKVSRAKPKEEKAPQEPKKPRKKKPKKPQKERPPAPLPEKIGGALEYAQALLPVALEAAKGMWRGLRVDVLELELTDRKSVV